ncbi:PadR family transcriptional regulator [Clostridium sp. Cult3]|uniref:PadR family transcriptional regulator n=1 Tax=Clostridium sp. Cult3 TaxID=2079004 RepID=UPI001F337696|nr:PadR family transcriptional regulator [Clostridium sp. Cult3]MCF6460910.1 PadR family transcriptional regulator [Clostridium sp. Cult3]
MNIQFKKGVLELCVLSLLIRRDYYGYELVEHISKYINISEGTIYPLLRRFRKEGYVTTYLQESQEGPPRKYYRITEVGERAYEELVEEWQNFTIGVNKIIRGDFSE